MSDFFSSIGRAFSNSLLANISWFDVLDIAIMTVIIYQVLKFFKNTKAIHVLKGLALLIIALAVASWLGLPTITWMLSSIFTSGIIILVIMFQPELRRAFENLGRGHFFDNIEEELDTEKNVDELVKVADNLSRRHVGALIVFTKKSDLKDIIATGTALDARISAELIENIFEPNTPLHDGAMIITGSRVVAAGCFLPLSENNNIEKSLGTRHRAALGMSEQSDALVLVVSEETGVISAAHGGSFQRYLDLEMLRKLLSDAYAEQTKTKPLPLYIKLFTKLFGKGDDTNGTDDSASAEE